MKLIKIDFDHKLIGTEGIVVIYEDGEEPDFVKDYPTAIVSVAKNGDSFEHFTNGRSCGDVREAKDLIMYRTVKVMTVDEFKKGCEYYNLTPAWTFWNEGADALAAAIKRGEVDISDING
jgi:hypothetical protein